MFNITMSSSKKRELENKEESKSKRVKVTSPDIMSYTNYKILGSTCLQNNAALRSGSGLSRIDEVFLVWNSSKM